MRSRRGSPGRPPRPVGTSPKARGASRRPGAPLPAANGRASGPGRRPRSRRPRTGQRSGLPPSRGMGPPGRRRPSIAACRGPR
eukprot:14013474-Alexandrium_andersonii.AAC.1